MQESIVVLTPPAVPPVALADAKLHLRVEIADDDPLISALVDAATALVEARLKMALVNRDLLWTLDAFPNRLAAPLLLTSARWLEARVYPWSQAQVLHLPNPPFVAVASITYADAESGAWTVLDPATYLLAVGTPGRLAPTPGSTWPATQDRPGAVQIQYTAGFGPTAATVPPNLVAAIKLLVGHWYRNREAVSEASLTDIPLGVAALINASAYGFYS